MTLTEKLAEIEARANANVFTKPSVAWFADQKTIIALLAALRLAIEQRNQLAQDLEDETRDTSGYRVYEEVLNAELLKILEGRGE